MAFPLSFSSRSLQVRAARLARAAALVVAIASGLGQLLLALPVEAQPPFSSSFPHIYFHADSQVGGNLQAMAEFDVVSAPFWTQEGETVARLDSLRLLNPTLKRLAYVNPAGRSLPFFEDPNHVVNRLLAAIHDSWIVRNEMGQIVYFDPTIPTMPLLNLSDRCPRVGGKTWGEFIADFSNTQMLSTGRWEGIFWDNIWNGASWVNPTIPGSLDLDRNGVADPADSVDVWWNRGLSQMLARFRAQVGPGVLAVGNGNNRQFTPMNGRFFEDFPYREGWTQSMQQTADWQQFALTPSLIIMMTRSTETDYRRMRYGLCSSLIAGTFGCHHANQHAGDFPILYDEYRVDLGQPFAPPVELGIDVVAETDFENGIPPSFSTGCGSGQATLTTDPALVVEGSTSLLCRPSGGPEIWQLFLCTNPTAIPLAPGATYTLSFRYRVVSAPPADGYFFAGARSDVDLNGSARNAVILNPPAGTVGEVRGTMTLGNYPGYYLLWGLRSGGEIVIDSIEILTGQGGAFRRDYENGIALVNPTQAPVTIQVGPGFHLIEGVVDPFTNTGEAVTQVTLAAEDGLVLLADVGTPIIDPPAGVPQFFAFPNPVRLSTTTEVEFAGVPLGGMIAIYSPLGRLVRALTDPAPSGALVWDLKNAGSQPVSAGVYLGKVCDAERRVVGALRLALSR